MTKNKGGRPPTYKTPEEMQVKIDEYFEQCKGEVLRNKDNNPVFNKFGELVMINVKVPTITGLALHLGFNGRKSLLDYSGKKEFVNTIMYAKSRCESYAESRLYDRDGARGAEFSLKCNFGWRDNPEEIAIKQRELELKENNANSNEETIALVTSVLDAIKNQAETVSPEEKQNENESN